MGSRVVLVLVGGSLQQGLSGEYVSDTVISSFPSVVGSQAETLGLEIP